MHPTVVEQDNNPAIDSYVVGEGEHSWPELLHDFENGRLKRKYENAHQVDLNSIPLPKKDLFIIPEKYLTIDTVIAQRGCRYKCKYCSASKVYGVKVRQRGIEKVVEEIKSSPSEYIALYDENLFNSNHYGFRLLEEIQPLNKKLSAHIDPSTALDESIPEFFSKAGVKIAMIGFESVNPLNFSKNPKYVPPNKWKNIVETFHKYDIMVGGYFMVGFDNDGPDIFEKTIKEIKKAKIDIPVFAMVTPLPGTEMYSMMKDRIFEKDWSKFDLFHPVFEPSSMKVEQLVQGFGYLRKKSIYSYQKLISNLRK